MYHSISLYILLIRSSQKKNKLSSLIEEHPSKLNWLHAHDNVRSQANRRHGHYHPQRLAVLHDDR